MDGEGRTDNQAECQKSERLNRNDSSWRAIVKAGGIVSITPTSRSDRIGGVEAVECQPLER